MREIVLDTETTGLDPAQGHRLVEIGCVELVNFIPTGRTYHAYFNPEREMPEEAFRVHGLSYEFLKEKPKFSDCAADFLHFIGEARLVIHNAEFDMRFLNAELARLNHPMIPSGNVLDTLALARRKHPGAPNNLNALCQRYKIDLTSRTKHGAFIDAEILAKVYLELLGGPQAHLALSNSKQEVGEDKQQTPRVRPKPLESLVSPEQEKAHAVFVDTLGEKAIWSAYRRKI